MTETIQVSAIIPTWNRRDLVCRAIESVLAQTMKVDEIIVVDDGSTDGTREVIGDTYGERVCYVYQDNAGVSSARNRGMALARGRYLALLDSDDEWLPEKIRLQWEWLEQRPDYGMVLCDVERVTESGERIDIMRRRDAIPEDGNILPHVLIEPSLVPASVLMRREVFRDVGGFDEALCTGEDLEYHLRIARHWPVGVVEDALVRARRGHMGLSMLDRTYDDYERVMASALETAADIVSPDALRRARYRFSLRAARGRIFQRKWREAWVHARNAYATAHVGEERQRVIGLLPLAIRHRLASLIKGNRSNG